MPLPGKSIACLAADRNGGLWIGFTTGQIAYLKGSAIRVYGKRQGLDTESVNQIWSPDNGSAWAIADGRLMRLTNDRWEDFGAQHGLPPSPLYAFHFDRHGDLWTSGHRAIWHLSPGTAKFMLYPTKTLAVYQFFDAPDGAVWIADAWRSVRPLKAAAPSIPLHQAAQGLFLPDGQLWLAMNYPGVLQTRLSRTHGLLEHGKLYTDLSAPGTRAILADSFGNIFVGTNGGLDRYEVSPFRRYEASATHYYPSIATTTDGSLWIGGHDVPVVQYTNGEARPSMLDHGMGPIFVDSSDRLWMQDARKHSIRGLRKTQVTDLPSPVPAVHSASVQAMAEDQDGVLLVSMEGYGLWKYVDRWRSIVDPKLPGGTVLSMLRASDGQIWLGYRDSIVARMGRGNATIVTQGKDLRIGNVLTFYEHGNVMWAGGDDGVSFFQGERFWPLHLAEEDRTAGTSGIVVDHEENLWLNTQSGVVLVRSAQLRGAMTDRTYRAESELFTEHQGIMGTPAQMRPLPTALRDTSGRLWFATIDHLVSREDLDAGLTHSGISPRIVGFTIDDKYQTTEPSTLEIVAKGGLRNVSFDYLSVNLSAGERVRYRYRMDGFDRDWQEAGERRHASYTRLQPGTYRFRVMASDGYGAWQEASDPVELSIKPYLYQRRSFLVVMAIAAAVIIVLLVRRRILRATSRMRRRGAVELAERQRIARVLHDTLLQGVQGLLLSVQAVATELPEDSGTLQRMERILDRTQDVLEEGRNSVHELRSAPVDCNGFLETLLQIANGIEQRAIRISGRIEGTERPLTPEVCADSFYICKEGILNALSHSEASLLQIVVIYGKKELVITVQDNGKGMPPEVARFGTQGHWGIVGMHERARMMRARLSIHSVPSQGTTVALRAAAKRAYLDGRRWPFRTS